MADFGKLKKKNRLGKPPKEHETLDNIKTPETYYPRDVIDLDGRSLRKTGRTHQFGTRVRVEFYKKMKKMAFDEEITIAELLEKAIDLYERKKDSS